jgi:UDP-N-acetylmuramate--alanine ligase
MSEKVSLKIFYSGIGGSGMSALALFDAERGHSVSGSDRAFDKDPSHPAYEPLTAMGVRIVPQDGSGIEGSLDFAVMSTAVEPDRPEVLRAKALGVPVKTRPEYLAEIVSSYSTIAVSGTSGKSTASGMLAYAMQGLGMDPNFLGGGRVKQFHTETNPGNCLKGDSERLVIEACESDGSIVNLRPEHTVLLNLALDHEGIKETARMFGTLAGNTKGRVIINADDENLKSIAIADAVTFSIKKTSSDYRAEDIAMGPMGSEFSLGDVRFKLQQPGKYNIYNALSAIAVLSELGVPLEEAARALADFEGLERRFDIMLDAGEKLVIDDYAHNPHKISALMEAVSGLGKSICYIFQPHGYAPTRLMKDAYIEAFTHGLRPQDHLKVLPIYYAGGTTSMDISSLDLVRGITERGKSSEAVDTREEVLEKIDQWQCYVVLGARDETLAEFAGDIARRLQGL